MYVRPLSCIMRLTSRDVVQGAAEWVLDKCTRSLNADGVVVPMSVEQRADFNAIVTEMANKGLRTLCLSYTDFPAKGNPADFLDVPYDENLIATCIVGIKVRPLFCHTPAHSPLSGGERAGWLAVLHHHSRLAFHRASSHNRTVHPLSAMVARVIAPFGPTYQAS